MDVPLSRAVGTLRFTVGAQTTEAEVDRLLDVLPEIVERARAESGIAVS
jgi:cysteine desulfurase